MCYIRDQTAPQHVCSIWETTELMMYRAQGSDSALTKTSLRCVIDAGEYTTNEIHLSIATNLFK